MDEKIADVIWRASDLIYRKRYFEARVLLTGIRHPVAQDWIHMLDERLVKSIYRTVRLLPTRAS